MTSFRGLTGKGRARAAVLVGLLALFLLGACPQGVSARGLGNNPYPARSSAERYSGVCEGPGWHNYWHWYFGERQADYPDAQDLHHMTPVCARRALLLSRLSDRCNDAFHNAWMSYFDTLAREGDWLNDWAAGDHMSAACGWTLQSIGYSNAVWFPTSDWLKEI